MSKECTNNKTNDSVCIHTDKVYDACKDKDCALYILFTDKKKKAKSAFFKTN